jgi:hypothetical protein
MKKAMSAQALKKEAAYWNAVKAQSKLRPGTICHK